MHNRVTWKKGMRLSTEVFNAMDNAAENLLCKVSLLGSANRYGLFPASKPFDLSVNISGDALEVSSLSCHGITKSGCLIDIDYDSNYANTFDTRIPIATGSEGEAFYLIVRVNEGKWREIDETYSELSYSFDLVGENSPIADNCLPIGMLVNQFGWRLNETDFAPPCLYVTAHPKLEDQLRRATDVAKDIFLKCLTSHDCIAKLLLSRVWSDSSAVYNRLDKDFNTVTPGQLLASLQQLANSFLVGCYVDHYVSLDNQEPFVLFVQKAYDAKNIYRDIETGLSLCAEISVKLDSVCDMTEPQVQVEEKPRPVPHYTPQPMPQPVTDPGPGRRRWEGIEI